MILNNIGRGIVEGSRADSRRPSEYRNGPIEFLSTFSVKNGLTFLYLKGFGVSGRLENVMNEQTTVRYLKVCPNLS